jgi:hypothetical protein
MKKIASFAVLTALVALFAIATLTTPAQADKPVPINCYYYCDHDKDHFILCCEYKQNNQIVAKCRNTGPCIPIFP